MPTEIEIKMPDLSTTDSEVTLLRWLIEVGERVGLGQALFEIETDKATMEVESVAAGVLKAIHVQPGERVAVGQLIAQILSDQPSQSQVYREAEAKAPAPPVTVQAPRASSAKASLFARNKSARQTDSLQSIPLSPVQRETARRLQKSKLEVPHFYLSRSASAEAMLARKGQSNILWDAFFVQAVAKAAGSFERMRYRFDEDKLSRIPGDAIGVAVDIGDELFVVPVEHPLGQSLEQISERIASHTQRIRQGDAAAKRMGSTYLTISNLGGSGVESFTAILNPPETTILAIGSIAAVPHVRDGQLVVEHRVNLTLSVDHRAHSGKYAAAFLGRIVDELEAIE